MLMREIYRFSEIDFVGAEIEYNNIAMMHVTLNFPIPAYLVTKDFTDQTHSPPISASGFGLCKHPRPKVKW